MKSGKLILAAAFLLLLTACGQGSAPGKFVDLSPGDSDTVTIPTEDITADARFYNFDADGVTVQLVALRDAKDKVHAAFNTCQSCSPSPEAFYSQNGDLLQCNNCGFTFTPDEVGVVHGGCNPWPIEGVKVTDTEIVVPVSSIVGMKRPFSTWQGPVK